MHDEPSQASGLLPRWAGLFLLVLAWGPWEAVEAEPDDDTRFRFDRITVEHGLSHNAVYAIRQDSYGFMWFGTQSGLNKYDGYNFTLYEHVPGDSTSLSDSWITAVLEDRRGNLWVGTRSGGLNRLDRSKDRFVRYPYSTCPEGDCDPPRALNSPNVSSLYEDRFGAIWIGTMGGLSRLDPQTDTFIHFRNQEVDARSLSGDKVWCLAGDKQGTLWVGTWDKGLSRLDAASGTFVQYRADQVDGSHIPSDRVRAVSIDRNGEVWIGTSGGGLSRHDPSRGSFEVYLADERNPSAIPNNSVWTLLEDSRGVIWVGTYGGGLSRFDRRKQHFRTFRHDPEVPTSLGSDVVTAIYEDRSGIIWVGGQRGVSRYNTAQERHVHYRHNPRDPNTPSGEEILTLSRSQSEPDIIWIGTHGGGLDRFDSGKSTFTHYTANGKPGRRLSSNIVTAVDEDRSGCVWVGTNAGLNCLNPVSGRIDTYTWNAGDEASLAHNYIFDILVDRENTVWVGTDGGGLNRFDREKRTFIRFQHDPLDPTSLTDANVKTIFEDSRDNIWVGTIDGGLNRFNRRTNAFISYRHNPEDPTSISHNRVLSIHEDPSGMLWIGTFNGLNQLNPETGKFKRFNRTDGLPVEPYLAIAGDGRGGLWLTTTGRLTHFEPRKGLVRHYTDRSGLSPNRYNVGAMVVTKTGDVVVGGSNGFSRFRPPAIEHDYIANPRLVVTAFKKLDQVVEREIFSDESISLTHNDRFFTLEFAVLDYTSPDKHQYEFMLEGYDSGWQQASGPVGRASYANFRPSQSEYIFKLRAANSHGAWNAMWVRVLVIPPWWRTLWFQLSAILTVGVLLGSTVTYRVNRRKREKAETLRLLTESRERERQYLARELHDSPLQNLYSMRHKLEVISRNPVDPESERMLEELHSVVQSTAEDLRILCGELRPPSLGQFGLEKAIRAHIRDISRRQEDLSVELDLEPDGKALPDHLRHSLFRIYQSTIANVLRHAHAKNVWVSLKLLEGRILLEIKDDGRGFNVPKNWLTLARSKHFGLLGISEWAEAIEATFQVESSPGKGTTVRVSAPRPDGPPSHFPVE